MARKSSIESYVSLVAGMGLGAGLMYVLDPAYGRRRRALARARILHGLRLLRERGSNRVKDAWNTLHGAVAESRSKVRDLGRPPEDDVLAARVRSQLGHVVSHPGALEVTARDGRVVVSGPVIIGEIAKITDRLSETRGVQEFELRLTEHDDPGSVPGLQGKSRWQRQRRKRVS